MNIDSVGIVGGGAWGTALAQVMRHAGREVVLWARESEVVASINARHINEAFLPGITLDKGVRATSIAPGGVNTEFAIGTGREHGDPSLAEMMSAEDVAEVVLFAVTRPRNMRILTTTFRPMSEGSAG